MMLSDQQSTSPEGLTNSFGWSGRDEVVQHDVQELNRVLFAAIDDSLAGTPLSSMISDIYQGVCMAEFIVVFFSPIDGGCLQACV